MRGLLIWGGLAIVILIVWACVVIYLLAPADVISKLHAPGRLSAGELGSVGDSFGVITALFSGLAFAAVILTLLSQKEEMREMRTQMRSDRLTLLLADQFTRLRDARANAEIRKGVNASVKGEGAILHAFNHIDERFKEAIKKSPNEPKIELLRSVFRNIGDNRLTFITTGLSAYISIFLSVVDLLSDLSPQDRAPLMVLLNSAVDTQDLVYIHQYIIANTDPPFQEKVEAVGLFSRLGSVLIITFLPNGPYFNAGAYGVDKSVFASQLAEMKRISGV